MAAAGQLTLVRPREQHTPLRDGLFLGATLLLLAAWDVGGLDLPLARVYGTAQGFSWHEHWLTGGVLHGGARVLAWGLFGVLLASLRWSVPVLRSLSARERIWCLATMLLCVAVIPLLKRASLTSCPWSLAEFGGGTAQYVSHWAFGRRDGGPGGCFPAGHASTAFCFLAGWFALRERSPGAARGWLIVTVSAGAVLGWVQMMRGAHYLSHSMWTAWVCWAVTALSFHGTRAWREGGRADRAASAP
ncbi:MAG: phosphatase PAP2 family protein [Chitinophagaceae bacterium]|nr:phosphatase PAP2 family protein [Rubrivivax sp.]